MMSRNRYKSLDKEAQDIRLLTLLPGGFDAPVHISYRTVVLSDSYKPKFEALLYVWRKASCYPSIAIIDVDS